MYFSNIFAFGAFVAAVLAQSKIGFTALPAGTLQAGVPFTLKWAGGESNEPVTITLKNGPSDNLTYVATIAGKASGNSFEWTPSKSLPNGDYALEIQQGLDDVNYSGMFTLAGGSAALPSTTAAATLPSSSSSSSSASTTKTLVTPLASLNSTSTLIPLNGTNATTTVLPTGTGVVGTAGTSAGTGTALHRNTTLSSATLKSSSTKSSSTSGPSSNTATSTSSGSGPATSAPKSSAAQIGSPVALVLSVFAAVMYLG